MPVGELGGVADVLAGDGVHALLEQLVVGAPREHDAEPQRGEHREPQGVVLVHAQHPGHADLPARLLALAQAPVGEGAPELVVVEVGQVGLLGAALLGGAPLAAVARDVARPVGEGGDGELAVVLAQPAGGGLGGEAEAGELGQGHEPPRGAVVGLVGGQGRTEGAHEAGDVGTHHLTTGEDLEGAQDGVVEEGAALDGDALPQLGGVLELNDLVQGVAHHRVGQPGADLPHRGGLLLGLLDRGVHEHGAARAQVHRAGGHQGGVGELLDAQAHGLGEGLEEGAAPGRAGLVDANGVNGLTADTQVLHVLPANVNDAGHPGVEVGGGPVVGHGLHHSLVQVEGGLDQGLAVAGDAGAGNAHALGHLDVNAAQDLDGGGHGVALVTGVVLPDNAVGLVQHDGLNGGGPGVNTQEAVGRARGVLRPATGLGIPSGPGLPATGERLPGGPGTRRTKHASGTGAPGTGAPGTGARGTAGRAPAVLDGLRPSGRALSLAASGTGARVLGGPTRLRLALGGGSGARGTLSLAASLATSAPGPLTATGPRPAGALHSGPGVATPEHGQLLLGGEQGPHAGGGQAQGAPGGQARDELPQGGGGAGGEVGGAQGHVELGVGRAAEGVHLPGQGALKGGAQLGQEVQGAAQEHDLPPDGAAAGQAGDGLGDHGRQHGGGQVLAGGPLVDQGLEVGLGEHPAARGNGVQGGVAAGELVQAGGVGVEQLGHLVDKGPGASRAGTVHTLLGGGVEVGDLGVLAAELDNDVGLRVPTAHGLGLGNDLLDERQAHEGGQAQPGAAGDGAAHLGVREPLGRLAQEAGDLPAHVGVVAVVLGEDGLGGGLALTGPDGARQPETTWQPGATRPDRRLRQEDQLDGGRANVKAQAQGGAGRARGSGYWYWCRDCGHVVTSSGREAP